jgi:hypothetical protein
MSLLLRTVDSHDPTVRLVRSYFNDLCALADAKLNGRRVELFLVSTEKQARYCHGPYIVIDDRDGAELEIDSRAMLCGDNPPIAVWKNAVYRERPLYSEIGTPYHVELIRGCLLGPAADPCVPQQIPVDRLGLIKSPFCFGCYSGPQAVLKQIGDFPVGASDRPVDVSFAGRIDYPDFGNSFHGSMITSHRVMAIEAISKLPHACRTSSGLNAIPFQDYVHQLLSSKIIVSPYGYGETCFRDWEAIFAGALLIKPSIDHIEGFPFHVPCKPDFSDLAEVVALSLERLNSREPELLDSMRETRVREIYRCSSEVVVEAMWSDIEAAVCVG